MGGMRMRIRSLSVTNLFCVEDSGIDLSGITVLYGRNGTGKTTAVRAIQIMQNIIRDGGMAFPGILYAPVLCGGFRDVVFRHDTRRQIGVGLVIEAERTSCRDDDPPARDRVEYSVRFSDSHARFELKTRDVRAGLDVSLPYSGNRFVRLNVTDGPVFWNGIRAWAVREAPSSENPSGLLAVLNGPSSLMLKSTIIHQHGTGYDSVLREIADIPGGNPGLAGAISGFLQTLTGMQLSVVPGRSGEDALSLEIRDRDSGMPVRLIGAGDGVVRLLHILIHSLRPECPFVVIEGPEIHLHPSATRILAGAVAMIVTENPEKQFLITTHSEVFLSALLARVAAGALRPEDLSCYLAERRDGVCRFVRKAVNRHGQIEGGLREFTEGDLEDLGAFLGV